MLQGTLGKDRFEYAAAAEVAEGTDVLVAGGGTAGIVAALAAARTGARTLLVEEKGFLGGMMTGGNAGLTTYVVHEKDPEGRPALLADLAARPGTVHVAGGIPMEITRRLASCGAASLTEGQPGAYVFTSPGEFKLLLMDLAREAGVRLLLHSTVVDVHGKDGRISGVLVRNKSGVRYVPVRQCVDATGDGDVAALAGAPFFKGVGPEDEVFREDPSSLGAMGQMGVMYRTAHVDVERLFAHLRAAPGAFQAQRVAGQGLEEAYRNARRGDMACLVVRVEGLGGVQLYNSPVPGVFTVCCPCCPGDGTSGDALSEAEVRLAREVRRYAETLRDRLPGFERSFVLDVPEAGVRETRHVYGDRLLTLRDILLMRDFEDSVGRGSHPVDIKPVPSWLKDADLPARFHFHVPFGILRARGLENLLLAGRCVSCTHEASGCLRTTVQCMVTGQAAGTASALCVAENVDPRSLSVGDLRARLLRDGVVL